MSPQTASIALQAHPGTVPEAAAAVRGLQVRAARSATRLDLLFTLEGQLARLRLPPPSEPRRADDLWRSTCFEAFAAADASVSYCELNVAPSQAWALYCFSDYRARQDCAPTASAPLIASTRRHDTLELHATVELAGLIDPGTTWHLALAAVIEDCDGRLSYWSVRHAPGKPDFHHRDAFAVELAA